MPELFNVRETVRKELPLIFVIDVSKNNKPVEIAEINFFMSEILSLIKDEDYYYSRGEITIGVLLFSEKAKWVTESGLISIEDFEWNDVKADKRDANIDEAIKELAEKLSRSSFLTNPIGYLAPQIIFVSNGRFSIDDGCMKRIEAVNNSNRWYQYSNKIAVAVGETCNEDILAQLTGTKECVIQSQDLEIFRRLLRDVTVRSIESIPILPNNSPEVDGIEVHIYNQVKHLDIDGVLSVKKCEVQITAPEEALDPFVDIKCIKRENSEPKEKERVVGDLDWSIDPWPPEVDKGLFPWPPEVDKSLFLKVTNTGNTTIKVLLNSNYYRNDNTYGHYKFSNINHLIKKTESIELVLRERTNGGSVVLRNIDNEIHIIDEPLNIDKIGVELLPGETCDLEVGDIICKENNEALISFMDSSDTMWREELEDPWLD